MSNLPSIKKEKHAKIKKDHAYFDDEEPDVDDDGNPITVTAALRIFHSNNNNKLYCKDKTFSSPMESLMHLN